jgi:5-formyltetrahydrofolate cyclo-ligase
MIVPLMGFVEDCHRIGYGGGFYDRTIEQIKKIYNNNVLMIGVAYEA